MGLNPILVKHALALSQVRADAVPAGGVDKSAANPFGLPSRVGTALTNVFHWNDDIRARATQQLLSRRRELLARARDKVMGDSPALKSINDALRGVGTLSQQAFQAQAVRDAGRAREGLALSGVLGSFAAGLGIPRLMRNRIGRKTTSARERNRELVKMALARVGSPEKRGQFPPPGPPGLPGLYGPPVQGLPGQAPGQPPPVRNTNIPGPPPVQPRPLQMPQAMQKALPKK